METICGVYAHILIKVGHVKLIPTAFGFPVKNQPVSLFPTIVQYINLLLLLHY